MVRIGSTREGGRAVIMEPVVIVLRGVMVGAVSFAGCMILVSWLFSFSITTNWVYPINTVSTAFLAPITFGLGFTSSVWMVLPLVVGLAISRRYLSSRMSVKSLRLGRAVLISVAIGVGLGYLAMQLVSELSSPVDDQYLLLRLDISALLVFLGAVWFDAKARRRDPEHAIN